MKTLTNNYKINKFQNILEGANGDKQEMKKVLNRISDALCSHTLGRDLFEKVEDFYNRKPELKEFRDWARTIELTHNYKLVNY